MECLDPGQDNAAYSLLSRKARQRDERGSAASYLNPLEKTSKDRKGVKSWHQSQSLFHATSLASLSNSKSI